MKTWIKRTLIGTAAATVLFGGLAAAWASQHHRGMGRWSENEVAELKLKVVEKAGRQLELDSAQKAKLSALADSLQAQRSALLPAGQNTRAELQALMSGPTFDRSKATALVDGKLNAVKTQSPAVVAAMGDFYDSLKPAQQTRLREMMDRGEGFGRHGHGERGDHDGHKGRSGD